MLSRKDTLTFEQDNSGQDKHRGHFLKVFWAGAFQECRRDEERSEEQAQNHVIVLDFEHDTVLIVQGHLLEDKTPQDKQKFESKYADPRESRKVDRQVQGWRHIVLCPKDREGTLNRRLGNQHNQHFQRKKYEVANNVEHEQLVTGLQNV